MLFNIKEKKNNETNLIKIGALLIHTAKIDENYSKEEEEIVKKTLQSLGAKENNLNDLIEMAKKYNAKILTTEKDYNRLSSKNAKNIEFIKIKLKIKNKQELVQFLETGYENN